jgi:exosortase E/protease (VPEID-CTERM system)
VALVAVWLAWGVQGGTFTAIGAASWFLAGLVILPVTAITWSASIVPYSFWMRWLSRSPSAGAIGALVAILSRSAGYFAQMLWLPLCHYTFVAVDLMLHGLGLSVVSDSGRALVGTARFAVFIAPACSGLEGVALICVFIAAYLWFYRAEYRFPAALLLIPAGAASIWILNAVRITALILIGQWYDDVAVTGFHSVAGWIFFNLAAFGLVGASRNVGWLTRADEADLSRDAFPAPNPALPYLIPLLLTTGVAMLTVPFADGFDAAYPARVIIAALALWWYGDRLCTVLAGLSWTSAGLGTLCFLLWVVLTHSDHHTDAAIALHLRGLPVATLTGWILFRVIGAVITVPIVEELAFRGYLLRKLIASDFESVPFDKFTWSSFLISAVAFGALHQSWIGGVMAGVLFSLAMYRRGRLADAVAAHATANALLAGYVIATGYWSLWS